jgi:hypothetical protein
MAAAQTTTRRRVGKATAIARKRERTLVWWALGVAVLSRGFIFVVGFLGRSVLPVRHPHLSVVVPPSMLYHGSLGRLLNGWASYDAAWYLSIARHGYEQAHSQAFFPLYPLVVRLLAGAGIGWVSAGVAISLACFLGATVLLYEVVSEALNARVALWTVVFLSIAPTSFFFQAIYTESLFLMLSVALFFFAQRRRWLVAGLMGLLATTTRSAGILLVVPLALFYLQSVGWQWRRVRAGILSVALVPCGLVVYMAYLWSAYGDPLLFSRDERQWGRYFAPPYVTLWLGVRSGRLGAVHLFAHDGFGHASAILWHNNASLADLINLVALLAVVALVALGWRRLGAPYTAYAVFAIIFVLFSPANREPLMSLPRFAVVVFPLCVALAAWTERRPFIRAIVAALCLVGLTWLSARFVLFVWVA